LNGRANANLALKNYNDAATDYTTLLGANPGDSTALFNRGVVYNNLKQWDKAAADFEKYVTTKPDDEAAYNALANAYVSQTPANWAKAADAYTRYLAKNPKDAKEALTARRNRGAAYYNLKQYDKALPDYEAYVAANPGDADANTILGELYAITGKSDAGIAQLTKTITANEAAGKKDPKPYFNRGVLYQNSKQVAKAAPDFETAAKYDTDPAGKADAFTLASLAYTQSTPPANDKAIVAATGALTAKPGYPDALILRADAYLNQKEWAKAAADYKMYLGTPAASDPKNSRLAAGAAESMAAAYINAKDYANATSALTAAISKAPDNTKLVNLRGQVQLAQKQYDPAIADFTAHLAKNGNDDVAYMNRGRAYLAKKDEARAAEDFEKALSIKPSFDAANLVGGIYLNMAQAEAKKDTPDNAKIGSYYDRAIAMYNKAIGAAGNAPGKTVATAYYNQGLAHYNKAKLTDSEGSYKAAIDAYTKYLQADPAATDKAEVQGQIERIKQSIGG
jgi:tetratricopeptide (TPR) repeat protein